MNIVLSVIFVVALCGFSQVKSEPTSCYTCSNWDTCNDEHFDSASIPKINCETAKEELLRSGENYKSLLFNNLKLNTLQTTTIDPSMNEENRAVAGASSESDTVNVQNSPLPVQPKLNPSGRSWGLEKYVYQMVKENVDRNNMEMACFKNVIHGAFGNLTMRHCFPKTLGRTYSKDLCAFVTRLERDNHQMNTECFVCDGDDCNSASTQSLSISVSVFTVVIFYLMK